MRDGSGSVMLSSLTSFGHLLFLVPIRLIRVVGHWHLQVAFTPEVLAGYIGSVNCWSLLQVIRRLILDVESPWNVVPFTSEPIVLHLCLCWRSCRLKLSLGQKTLVFYLFSFCFPSILKCAKVRQVQSRCPLTAFTEGAIRAAYVYVRAIIDPP